MALQSIIGRLLLPWLETGWLRLNFPVRFGSLLSNVQPKFVIIFQYSFLVARGLPRWNLHIMSNLTFVHFFDYLVLPLFVMNAMGMFHWKIRCSKHLYDCRWSLSPFDRIAVL
jgi:predicted membrane chloride channel (bestrophin family)